MFSLAVLHEGMGRVGVSGLHITSLGVPSRPVGAVMAQVQNEPVRFERCPTYMYSQNFTSIQCNTPWPSGVFHTSPEGCT